MFNIFKKKSVNTDTPVKIPQHIAFICDGNRRWAEMRGLPPLMGHRAGISNFENLVDWFIARGVTTITFYIFSTENWNRSDEEVNFLMDLFYTELNKNMKHAIENGKPVDKESFETFMDTGDLLPVDLMVRTSNENRISNFLLWKLAYAELLFVPEHWPDLVKSEKLWQHVLDEYQKRNRRFGGGKKKNYSGKK